MRIAIVGKYPPIEGGVSTHQYWCAHSLAALGHIVHVVTNAKEVEPPFRVLMRESDWLRCEVDYPSGGSVRVHWTDAADRRQRHIPWHNPFVTKLASLAAQVIHEHDLQLVFSYYLEPYGVAGHLAAEMTGRPHVVKHAGSDVGHLRLHEQFRPLYDHIFRTARGVITGGGMVTELAAAGVDEDKMLLGDDFRIPESVFNPNSDALDLSQVLRESAEDPLLATMCRGTFVQTPYLGVYGKLGDSKGTFDLLEALRIVRDRGHVVSLIVLGHGFAPTEKKFHKTVDELSLNDCVLQLPFLPNWRIPQFIRACRAVCFLERDFPIVFHTPTVVREVMACGTCLIASAEILERQLFAERLIHAFNCLAVENVCDSEQLADAIQTAVEHPDRADQIGRRGHQYSCETESVRIFPRNYEAFFADIVEGQTVSRRRSSKTARDEFAWTRQVIDSLPEDKRDDVVQFASQYGSGGTWALGVYARLLQLIERGELVRNVLVEAVRLELQLLGILDNGTATRSGSGSSLFRLDPAGHASLDEALPSLYVQQAPGLKMETYSYDIGELMEARTKGSLPLWVSKRPSQAAIVPGADGARNRVISLSPSMSDLLLRCNRPRKVAELVTDMLAAMPALADAPDSINQAIITSIRMDLLRLAAMPQ